MLGAMREPTDLFEIALAEEARIARSVADVADDSEPFAGGIMSRGAPGAWTNSAYGPGLAGPVDDSEVARLIEFYEPRGIEPRVELSPFAHPTLLASLERERFTLKLFENVFYRDLDAAGDSSSPHDPPPGLTIERVDPADAAAVEAYAQLVLTCFLPDLDPLPEGLLQVFRRVVRHPRAVCIVARLDGRAVGASGLETLGPVAALFGAGVVPEARRKGVQQAMLAWRLNEASRLGARFATISSRPRVATERNVRRMGFQVAYTKAILTRPGSGLVTVAE